MKFIKHINYNRLRNSVDDLHEMVLELEKDKFFGQLIINFESGKIVLCKKTESIKL